MLNDLKRKIKSLDSDEGIRLESKRRGIKVFLNRRPSGSYIVEITGEKISNMGQKREDIRFVQNIDAVIALVNKTLGKSFSVIEY
jgi:hypothetical protein